MYQAFFAPLHYQGVGAHTVPGGQTAASGALLPALATAFTPAAVTSTAVPTTVAPTDTAVEATDTAAPATDTTAQPHSTPPAADKTAI
ncbi:MAG: hypothetical protein ACRC02_01500 [Vogesella sp.]|uniref:hypothetical protein n=1 Tax=Vogesella sp. TaxID=1904252 RepID=UPI003F33F3A8